VPAFAAPCLDPEPQATDFRRIAKLGDEAIPFLHDALSDKIVRPSIRDDGSFACRKYFGTTPQLWLKLQSDYDLRRTRAGEWARIEPRVRVFTAQ
jgi:hypothetical protein